MNKKTFFTVIVVLIALTALTKLLSTVFLEPWVGNKMEAMVNEGNEDFTIEIDKVHISMIRREIQFSGIHIESKGIHQANTGFSGSIASIKCTGIKLLKAIFNNDIDIREITITNANIKGTMPFSGGAKKPMLSPANIRLGKLQFVQLNLAINNTASAQAYAVKKGDVTFHDLQIEKKDAISTSIIQEFDFEADEILFVSADSMYTYKSSGLKYSHTSGTMSADSFFIQPNYENYDFTSRYKYETDRIEASFSSISVHDFSAMHYLKSKSLMSSFIEIGQMEINVFRDKQKPFKHVNKTAFQDLIYNYPGDLHIDSIELINGNLIYTEHAEKANKPGSISFNNIQAKILKVTNDKIYKTKKDFLVISGQALLMGKGKMTILLKGEIYDPENTFLLSGTLSDMQVKALNPMLEKNAFVYVNSGKVDAMNFSLIANNTQARGKMTMLYHALDLTVKNKQTDDTTALKEQIISFLANKKVIDANPVSGKEARAGTIVYIRDPEKSLFNYCFKAIWSGMKSSLTKSSKDKKNT
ncbi:MAG: DUF748 domain-containing protein [Chitinophagales bacterium]